jgi:hypothetical protein
MMQAAGSRLPYDADAPSPPRSGKGERRHNASRPARLCITFDLSTCRSTPGTAPRRAYRRISHVGVIPSVTTRDRDSRHRAVRDAATAQVAVTADQSGRRK